jgi:hypothetical protein
MDRDRIGHEDRNRSHCTQAIRMAQVHPLHVKREERTLLRKTPSRWRYDTPKDRPNHADLMFDASQKTERCQIGRISSSPSGIYVGINPRHTRHFLIHVWQ